MSKNDYHMSRSENMAQIPSQNTRPEKRARSELFKMGLRFRIHRRDLPGNPDIVFPKAKMVIFVHGCFWHQHDNCQRSHTPQSNQSYWGPKLSGNVARDKRVKNELKDLGWTVKTLWECETSDIHHLNKKLRLLLKDFLK